ncbi:unnamed protein product [Rotaria sp. Silwood1]|nr:unnamed protein product [Rotaria sp. Silwood1]CAF1599740.1 unnamed protein product [Rotaria sp. Silwood1]CAF3681090.1 unnamed protein product [Rotaria sp. Silwood1]CAF3705992.1 unnamed protein product [Rotaria sp. Silwood1]CAF3710525.1 unnamed protein product [Rotaria sp. Silwood1]
MPSFSACLPNDKLREASFEHRFIKLISTGEITRQQFNTWLAQDYLFVIFYIRFGAHVLVHAPRQDYKFLIKGLSTIEEELTWFEKKLKEKNILINDIQPLFANRNYQHWLDELMHTKKSYLGLITAFYAMELCYYEAWKSVKNHDYQEFVNRWGSEEFGQFIEQLRVIVDAASITASDNDKQEACQLWDDVMRLEVDFWDMAINEKSE